MRKLLVIAFHYPPENSSTGVLRTLKFTEYLGNHGWGSEVISVPEKLYTNKDTGLAPRLPAHIRLHRVWAADIKSLFGFRGIYPSVLAFPDRYWLWFFAAVRKGASLIRSQKIDAIYSTYPMPTSHLIGFYLKKRFNLPWIADFRDPWVEDSIPPLRRRAEGFLERHVMKHADRIICNTPAMREYYLSRYPDVSADKFVTITNGYDEIDFANLTPISAGKFHIIYPGMLSEGNRNPEPLLAAIRFALDKNWLSSNDLLLTFLGCGPYGKSRQFHALLEKYNLNSMTEAVVDRIPYREAIGKIAGADVLAVLSEPIGEGAQIEAVRRWSHLQVPAKVYEYLRIGRPILALVSGGAVFDLLRVTGGGVAIAPTHTEEIAVALRDYYANRNAPAPATENAPVPISCYARENLTTLLAAELDKITA